ncbi:MAG: response regulator transcription factor [Deltaproteobacteria bacterium]|nr:response regulator transcription factor [Deltaproteobacteria bacterium]
MANITDPAPDKPQTRILLVDDHPVVAMGLMGYLKEMPEFQIVGHADSGRLAVQQVLDLKPDVVIMDISMPDMNGIEATIAIRREAPQVKVIIYSMHSDQEYLIELVKAGISGYVLKGSPIKELITALSVIKDGSSYYPKEMSDKLADYLKVKRPAQDAETPLSKLSKREYEIFLLLADGWPIKKIAANLGIRPKTVETHKYNLMDKLHAKNVSDLTKLAIRFNLIII